MASDRKREITRSRRRTCRRENSQRKMRVAMKPTQNTATARVHHLGSLVGS
jgi:hypothetical protein